MRSSSSSRAAIPAKRSPPWALPWDGRSSMNSVIALTDIRRVFTMGDQEFAALKGVSFAVAAGEFVAIMGASGSGKSTCMNILGCLDLPTSGHFLLEGEDVGSFP